MAVLGEGSTSTRTLGGGGADVTALAADGPTRVAVGRSDGSVELVDLASGSVVTRAQPVDAAVRVLAAGPDVVVTGHADGTVAVTGEDGEVRVLGAHSLEVTAVAVDGRWIVSGSDDNLVLAWPSADDGGEPTVVARFSDMVTALAVLADDRVLAGSQDGELTLLDLVARAELASLPTPGRGGVQDVEVLADGVAVAVGVHVRVWNVDESSWAAVACVAAGRPLRQFEVDALLGGTPPPSVCATS